MASLRNAKRGVCETLGPFLGFLLRCSTGVRELKGSATCDVLAVERVSGLGQIFGFRVE